jgi:hypothetical protein
MKISSRQQLAHPVFYPLITLHTTAAWAMPVATAMVLVMHMSATFIAAPVLLHTYGCCVAAAQAA